MPPCGARDFLAFPFAGLNFAITAMVSLQPIKPCKD
jgi:hypothetical protein